MEKNPENPEILKIPVLTMVIMNYKELRFKIF